MNELWNSTDDINVFVDLAAFFFKVVAKADRNVFMKG